MVYKYCEDNEFKQTLVEVLNKLLIQKDSKTIQELQSEVIKYGLKCVDPKMHDKYVVDTYCSQLIVQVIDRDVNQFLLSLQNYLTVQFEYSFMKQVQKDVHCFSCKTKKSIQSNDILNSSKIYQNYDIYFYMQYLRLNRMVQCNSPYKREDHHNSNQIKEQKQQQQQQQQQIFNNEYCNQMYNSNRKEYNVQQSGKEYDIQQQSQQRKRTNSVCQMEEHEHEHIELDELKLEMKIDQISGLHEILELVTQDQNYLQNIHNQPIQLILIQIYYYLFIDKDCETVNLLIMKIQNQINRQQFVNIEYIIQAHLIYGLLQEFQGNYLETEINYLTVFILTVEIEGDFTRRGFRRLNNPFYYIQTFVLQRLEEVLLKQDKQDSCAFVEQLLDTLYRNEKQYQTVNIFKSNFDVNNLYQEQEKEKTEMDDIKLIQMLTNLYNDRSKKQYKCVQIRELYMYIRNVLSRNQSTTNSIVSGVSSIHRQRVNLGNDIVKLVNKFIRKDDYGIVYQMGSIKNDKMELVRQIKSIGQLIINRISCGYNHCLAILISGQVIGWGNNEYYQCGQRMPEQIDNPCLVYNLYNVVDISCGSEHSLALTNRQQVYSWGNGEGGLLGHGDTQSIYMPRIVSVLNSIESIKSGGMHSLAIDNSGRLYVWGRGEGGQLGLPLQELVYNEKSNEVYLTRPKQIVSLQNHRVKKIEAGDAHSVVLTQMGDIYGWGYNNCGQLSIQDPQIQEPIQLMKQSDKKFVQIRCGSMFTFMTSYDGVMYGCGINDYQQLGIDSQKDDVFRPLEVGIKGYQVIKMAAGQNHCLTLGIQDRQLKVYSWGLNKHRQLGIKKECLYSLPAIVEQFSNQQMQDIECSAYESFLVSQTQMADVTSVYQVMNDLLLKFRVEVKDESMEIVDESPRNRRDQQLS